ncbi:SRPBCC family protein [Mangrovihabitans endophyticus]|uniref:Polyketide cyclase / dehydrase and lipid transport n=1 Tax=Mangrovihabitans endophyticus TaxID=1751298 RepID=A0A8J3BWG3_9ACTN|nr:SRPBCC family protein [Mangrovihabitans endophyticus]GGK73979.1 hypothetical protein GCM10012284_04950 [Mangrovihabitans endophyticus]
MTTIDLDTGPLFDIHADVRIAAPPAAVYARVSDLPGCGRWSTECTGGEWVRGTPGTVGAVFRGTNHRDPDVVSWAPVVRGSWTTDAEIVAAEPGVAFRWAIRAKDGRAQQSVWGFDLAADGDGTRVTHHFRMGAATEGIRGIVRDMDGDERERFFAEWGAKVHADVVATLDRIKALIEDAAD